MGLAEGLDRSLHTPMQGEVIDRFVTELPLFRMVLRRLLDATTRRLRHRNPAVHGPGAVLGRLAGGPEAAVWADELLRRYVTSTAGCGPGWRWRASTSSSRSSLMASRYDLAAEAARLAEEAGDPFTLAAARLQMAIGLGWRGIDLDRAEALLSEARAGMVACGDLHYAAVVREFEACWPCAASTSPPVSPAGGGGGRAPAGGQPRGRGPRPHLHRLRPPGYRRPKRRPAGLRRGPAGDLGDPVATWLRATVGSGHASLALGDAPAAAEAFRLATTGPWRWGDHRIVGTALVGLATLARGMSDDERCVALLRAATDEALAGGDPTDAVTAAGMLAEMLADRGADDEAAVLLGRPTSCGTRWACGWTSGSRTTPARSA
jgi:hypothetical protein